MRTFPILRQLHGFRHILSETYPAAMKRCSKGGNWNEVDFQFGTNAFTYPVSDGKLTATASITLLSSRNLPCDNAMSIVISASAYSGSVRQ
ncbi:hypothetical protein AE923_03090 [Xanthomonas arboricola]|uniref:hypothetical protein n=2 Tax=Xanthomonas arboricola TaxID=56448 RepID=UPI0006A403D6|nr:hypothetical protein [Xanthomonas arboricola]KOB11907.1 hypothetical protein AE923_03090 [Xanthomonas arboricola]